MLDWSGAIKDVCDGVGRWPLWYQIGWIEIRRRYKRTVLGPFWATGSTAIFVGVLGFLWAHLWGVKIEEYLPYLAAGLIVWILITTTLTECCSAFISAEPILMQASMPYSVHIASLIWRNVLVFFHNMIVFLVVWLIYPRELDYSALFFIPGLVLLSANCLWFGIILSIITTRFRDVQTLVNSVLQICMFVTPIMWPADTLEGRKTLIVDLNPMYHLIEIIRGPLMGNPPSMLSWAFTIGLLLIGWPIAIYFFARFRKRITYWL